MVDIRILSIEETIEDEMTGIGTSQGWLFNAPLDRSQPSLDSI